MKVGVFGAGAIGGSLGVRISAAGVPVRMVARPSLVSVADELVVFDRQERPHRPGEAFVLDESPEILHDVDVCLVTVKSRATEEAARILAEVLPDRCVVVSFQNGLRNPERLERYLKQDVVPGMVTYNVVRPETAVFRQATTGPIVVGRREGQSGLWMNELAAALARTGDRLEQRQDVYEVQAGKLLLNLNNMVCTVTGVPIATSVRSRTLRWCFSALMREGLGAMKRAGIEPRPVVGLPPWLLARLLNLPDAIVLRFARSIVDIDPEAKSSTLQDLEAGKPTEVDDLSGEIVRIARRAGVDAPRNALAVEAVHELEAAPAPRPYWSPEKLAQRLAALKIT
ncbi:MAG: 2-dehydropantoate 2-reductase [Myxococcota bacterium]|nr:2-dehydropantoate 2-reductase [Myxococcota bacterium]